MTSAPDEKTCEKSEFQGHGTGYREMGEVVCKAHRMTSTAGNGTEQPISAAQAKMRLPSLPVERSVFFFESAEVHFPSLQLPVPWDSFRAAHELRAKKKKNPLFGASIIRTGLLVQQHCSFKEKNKSVCDYYECSVVAFWGARWCGVSGSTVHAWCLGQSLVKNTSILSISTCPFVHDKTC